MKAHLFEFDITNFEQVYAVVDDTNKRLHISPVDFHYNITLNLESDLVVQLEQQTTLGEKNFNSTVRKVIKAIIEELFETN